MIGFFITYLFHQKRPHNLHLEHPLNFR
jgi:hypothetical protein